MVVLSQVRWHQISLIVFIFINIYNWRFLSVFRQFNGILKQITSAHWNSGELVKAVVSCCSNGLVKLRLLLLLSFFLCKNCVNTHCTVCEQRLRPKVWRDWLDPLWRHFMARIMSAKTAQSQHRVCRVTACSGYICTLNFKLTSTLFLSM